MTAAYIAVTVLAASAYLSAAYLAITRHEIPVQVAETVGAPLSWMIPLGFIQGAGGLGLVVGFAVPVIGTAAAVGLVLYYICAVGAHLRVHDHQIGPPVTLLTIALACLAVGLAHHGPA
jgi:DoxX-like family